MNRFPYPYTEKEGKPFIKFPINAKLNGKNILQVIDVDVKFAGGIGLQPE